MTKLPYYCEPYKVAFSDKGLCEKRKKAAKGIYPPKGRRQTASAITSPVDYLHCKTCKGVDNGKAIQD